MVEMDCATLREVAPELALGVLAGRDRAAAVAHLQDCPACEHHVRDLAVLGDRLTGLPPGVEPPLGFDTRVLRRLGFRGHGRWWRAAAVLVAGLLVAGGWMLRGLVHDDLTRTTIVADGHQVGDAFTYSDGPSWVYVELTALPRSGMVRCQLLLTDGRVVDVGGFPIIEGVGSWGGPAPLAEAYLAEVRILTETGALLGVGRMP